MKVFRLQILHEKLVEESGDIFKNYTPIIIMKIKKLFFCNRTEKNLKPKK